jgi:hypothetical protein
MHMARLWNTGRDKLSGEPPPLLYLLRLLLLYGPSRGPDSTGGLIVRYAGDGSGYSLASLSSELITDPGVLGASKISMKVSGADDQYIYRRPSNCALFL